MLVMLLFDNKNRSVEGPAPNNHNEYQYYDESSRKEIGLIREVLNDWFARYPEGGQAELRARFEREFQDPFYELLIHELLRRHNFELQPHPTLDWTNRHPEFLATNNEAQFYVEAKVVRGQSAGEASLEKLTATLYDEINKLQLRDFFLHIETVVFKSGMQPSGKRVKNFISESVPQYDPDEVMARLVRLVGLRDRPHIVFEDDDVLLEISLIPKSPEARGKAGRAIGMISGNPNWGKIDQRLRDAVKEKGCRYGDFDRPYLICVNIVGDEPPDDDDVFNALFGTLHFRFSRNVPNADPVPYRESDGAFFSKRAGANVGAVLITRTGISNVANARHWLVKNPNARHEFPVQSLRFHSFVVNEVQLEPRGGLTIGEVLGLKPGWPQEKNSTRA